MLAEKDGNQRKDGDDVLDGYNDFSQGSSHGMVSIMDGEEAEATATPGELRDALSDSVVRSDIHCATFPQIHGESPKGTPSGNMRVSSCIDISITDGVGVINVSHSVNLLRTIEYGCLYSKEKVALARYCTRRIVESREKFFSCFRCISSRNIDSKRIEGPNIDIGLLQAIDTLRHRKAVDPHIFSSKTDPATVWSCIEQIKNEPVFNAGQFESEILGNVIKAYIEQKLHGLLAYDVAKTLMKTFSEHNIDAIRVVLCFLPFTFSEEYRRCVKGIFDIISHAHSPSENHDELKNMLRPLVTVFFNKKLLVPDANFALAVEIVYMLYYLNYDNVPIEFLNK